jgi:hypothetical protein
MNRLNDILETWPEYATEHHPNVKLSDFLQSVITTWRMRELVVRE